ncbi:MAG: succinyl-diaminopimelate desuccinylase [Propionibacteriaceae bacterium]|jgi:succinyl-diaminopimelate desuccinylase|nr:succinyl-diaminopimelate desuccinylase [Propionibacteriaceae bacterium]
MLPVTSPIADLLHTIVDIESVSGNEKNLADEVEATLAPLNHLEVSRHGDTVVARTHLGRARRVAIAGHLDTVPVANNLPSVLQIREGREVLVGRGTVDMKGGVAVQLSLAAALDVPTTDVTWIFYDNEEVEATRNGLGRLASTHPDLVASDFAILMEPTGSVIEGGCQGSLRVRLTTHGVAAHSARSWRGSNAIHGLTPAFDALNAYQPATVTVDGLDYREGLNAVEVSGGIASNVIPDKAQLTVNYRFAPDKDGSQAQWFLRQVFAGYETEVLDLAEGARPGLTLPAVADFVAALGVEVRPKYGWTDVARFAALGIPAVNFGPGDPNLAHTDDEHVFLDEVVACRDALSRWLMA